MNVFIAYPERLLFFYGIIENIAFWLKPISIRAQNTTKTYLGERIP